MIGGMIGGISSYYVPVNILEKLFGIFLIIIAINLIFNRKSKRKKKKIKFSIYSGAVFGVIIGFFSGLLGLGGGLFLFPVLIFLFGFSVVEFIGISSIFVTLSSIGGTTSYILTGWGINTMPYSIGYVNLINFGIIAIFSIPFAYIGAKLTYKISQEKLKLVFSIVMISIALTILDLDSLIINLIF